MEKIQRKLEPHFRCNPAKSSRHARFKPESAGNRDVGGSSGSERVTLTLTAQVLR